MKANVRYWVVIASAAAALPGLPHPVRAAELPPVAVFQELQQLTTPCDAGHPLGQPLSRVSRVRLPEEQKRRVAWARLMRATGNLTTA